ncbi:MAG: serpin family protein [Anaerolineae bacterium]|nr:serpin family protein [Anaerolineae bacterium]
MRWLKAVLIVSLIFGVAACKKDEDSKSVSFKIAQADVEREVPADLSLIQTGQVDVDGADFAFEFYRQVIVTTDGNVVFSPYGIRQAFAMVYAGARGNTESQMTDVFNYMDGQADIHTRFNGLDTVLNGQEAGEGERFEINIANSLWLQNDLPVEPDFLDVLARNYGAGAQLVDFKSQPTQAADMINEWVSEQTRQKIPKMIEARDLDAETFCIIGNVVYFNAGWADEFDKSKTTDDWFNLLDGKSVSVPTMHRTAHYPFAQTEKYITVALPYVGETTRMIILMPKEGYFGEIETALDADMWTQIIETDLRGSTEIALSMPRFSIEGGYELTAILSNMGVTDLFNGSANLSGMSSAPLYVRLAKHNAIIEVDEEGTIAAAVTVIGPSLQLGPWPVDINRPFIYAIYDQPTGTILFLGRVINPAE